MADQEIYLTAGSPDLPERGMIGQTAVDADGTTRAVAVGQHGATVLEFRGEAEDGKLVAVAQLAAPQHWFTPTGQSSEGVLTAGMGRIEDWREGWRSYTVQGRYVLDADGTRLVAAPADAVAVDELSWRVDATGPQGEVALVSGFRAGGDAIEAVPWAREEGGRWVQGSPLASAQSTHAPGGPPADGSCPGRLHAAPMSMTSRLPRCGRHLTAWRGMWWRGSLGLRAGRPGGLRAGRAGRDRPGQRPW